jgi:hypothetical protein
MFTHSSWDADPLYDDPLGSGREPVAGHDKWSCAFCSKVWTYRRSHRVTEKKARISRWPGM